MDNKRRRAVRAEREASINALQVACAKMTLARTKSACANLGVRTLDKCRVMDAKRVLRAAARHPGG